MIKVGLTGGIGSGKTLVSKIFEQLRVPVFYADTESKRLLDEDENIIFSLKKRFGENIYSETGIKKAKLASLIFNNNEALNFVQSISHPKVRENFLSWSQQQNSSYVIMEAAILFETGGYKYMDYNILVYAPEDLRLKRVTERDGSTEEQIRERLKNQQPDEDKMDKVDWIIYNDGSTMIVPQVVELNKKIEEKIS